jgi:hypothetical protein
MLDLQPLIARLVDDLLQLIGGASVEKLREVMGPEDGEPGVRRRGARRSKPRTAPKPAVRPKRRTATRRLPVPADPAPAAEPPLRAEITDPERLLAAAAPTAPTRGSVRRQAAHVVAEEPSPPSGQRPAAGANVALRNGESVAHASERGGVVIRRRKRA